MSMSAVRQGGTVPGYPPDPADHAQATLDLLEDFPGLLIAEVGAKAAHVLDAQDNGDLLLHSQERVNLAIDVNRFRA